VTGGRRETARALLVDLDGVVRVFDPAHVSTVERQCGLPAGALARAGLAWDRLRPALVGEVSFAQWRAAVVEDLGGGEAADAAVTGWLADRGAVVPEVLSFLRTVRGHGIPVGLATNSMSNVDEDLAALGLTGEVDAVIASTAVGVHKPTREFFAAACAALGTPPRACLFVDDEDRNVRGARVAGLSAYRWSGVQDLPYLRAALGL
jgi:putative hydrolase of the HAD superfamily